MQSEFVDAICKIGVFMICAQVMVHFRPNASYEKYLKMLVSAMILVQMLRPICGLIGGKNAESLDMRVAWFEEKLNESLHEAVIGSSKGEVMREQMTLEEMRRRMEYEGGEQGTFLGEMQPIREVEIKVGEEEKEDGTTAGALGDPEGGLEEMVPQG